LTWTVVSLVIITVVSGSGVIGWAIGLRQFARQPYRVVMAEVHHVYMSRGTLATLYNSLHMLTDNNPSYIWFDRRDTFNLDTMPDHVQQFLPVYSHTMEHIANQTRQLVYNIVAKNPTATIHFFVESHLMLFPFYAVMRNGLPTYRFYITAIGGLGWDFTGGVWADNPRIHDYFGYEGEAVWNQHIEDFENLLEKFSEGPLSTAEYNNFEFNCRYLFVAGLLPNFEIWLQFPEYFLLNNQITPTMQGNFIQTSMVKRQPLDLLNQLNAEMRQVFFNATLGNPVWNRANGLSLRDYLNAHFDVEKPVMIVTGTRGMPDILPIIDDIIEKYGDDYVLMWKPHPIYTVYDTAMAERGLIVLPAQLPMEILMWAFPDAYLGGYHSTLFLGVRSTQVRFFIGAIGNELLFLYQRGFFTNLDKRLLK